MSSAEPHPDPELVWATTDRRDLHRGRVVLVEHDVLLPDGSASRYEVDESVPFAVATLVIDGDAVILSRQYRHPLGRWILDLPGGAGDAAERPVDAARRELEEELGLVAPEIRPLRTYAVNPGRASWLVHVFACTTPTTRARPTAPTRPSRCASSACPSWSSMRSSPRAASRTRPS